MVLKKNKFLWPFYLWFQTSEVTHALGDLLIYLFAEGFGSTEDTAEDSADERQQDATGTGMGEGEGQESVSSKIDDPSLIDGTDNEKVSVLKQLLVAVTVSALLCS
jgi:midasin (ATPase involved in ribosome maturation)